jgi:CDP-glycerol glycerophosphotransferase (TagB/SpsB family)
MSMLSNFSHKRIYIAPHTPRTTMFQKLLCENDPTIEFLGFIDKEKKGDNICTIECVCPTCNAIFILSQNHFESILEQYTPFISVSKLYKVDIVDNRYVISNHHQIILQKLHSLPQKWCMKLLDLFVGCVDLLGIQRSKTVFIAKSFIGNNTKALYLYTSMHMKNIILLSDHATHLRELSAHGLCTLPLFSLKALWALATAKSVIQDQGNYTAPLTHLNPTQTTIQMWHGIPLKRMNRLADTTYYYMISPSDYVNETSLADVIVAKKYLNLGYPRNDFLLKEHDTLDLLLCDQNLYTFAKSHFGSDTKIIVYMPTHREASTTLNEQPLPLMPLDFEKLNQQLAKINSCLIVKLHPFVMQFFHSFAPKDGYSHILFHSAQGDIYPILKYTDILITDYSSVYFDFLLLDRPIVFFDYDYEEYSSNMGGFVYEYNTMAPGDKVKTQEELINALESLVNGEDHHRTQRKTVCNLFYTDQDANASKRIMEALLV